jgi:hypothetical protein
MNTTASIPSPIRREFLGWDGPALPEVARRIAARYRNGQMLDLARVIVVVPGQRAGRRVQELLAFRAEDEELLFTPPSVVTEGQLPEMLYTPKYPFATDLVQDLAWSKAIRGSSPQELRPIVPHPPNDADALAWLQLAKVLRLLHRELAADGLDFADVHRGGPKLASFTESDRWAALAAIQRRYLEILDEQKLWDIQTARLKAIEFHEITTETDVILLGTVDLNTTLRQMLDQVAGRVTAYIVAPEELADRFDAHGCLRPEEWSEAEIDLSDEQLNQVDGPLDQAEAVSAWLGELNGRYRNDEVAIGVLDESLVPQLQRQLLQSDVNARWVEGVRLGETAPYRLLAAAVQFAGGRRYEDLAALLRHSDLEDWLRTARPMQARCSLPAQLDCFYNEHLPNRIRANRALKNGADWPDLAPALDGIEVWLAEAEAHRPLREWGDIFRKILGQVYGIRTLILETPDDEVLHRALLHILKACDQLADVPDALDNAPLSAADAFQVALGPLKDEALPPPTDAEAVEILGWLELPLDDSKALVVTSFNEGFVPKSTGTDAFLPDRLRKELNLEHNERRYARDAYATTVLSHSREELRVVFARVTRRDAQDTPLQPSRLIFACPDDALLRRARQFFADTRAPAAPRRLLLAPTGAIPEKSHFKPPAPVPGHKFESISVTRFKAYLACPYRFYLRHVRKLEAVDDAARELDGSAFGNLLHAALSALGRDPGAPRDSTRTEDIYEFLAERLHAKAHERYGAADRRASIRLQLEQARFRLKAFATKQAELVHLGWRILYAEDADERQENLSVLFPAANDVAEPFEPITLIGRIDRIDFHESTGTIRILDYKSADKAQTPEKTHRNGKGWIDLQLPLYRHLCSDVRLNGPVNPTVELGYFNLPKELAATGVEVADWNGDTLASADAEACRVIGNLRNAVFLPPEYDPVPPFSEDLAAICLDNVLGRPGVVDDDEGGQA